MSEFAWPISLGSGGTPAEPRTLRLDFGGGYAQRAGDGLNAERGLYQVQMLKASPAVYAAVLAFLRARKGYLAFTWTPPGEPEAKFICEKGPRVTFTDGLLWDLAMDFERVYDP